MALALAGLGRFDEAALLWTELIHRDPTDVRAHLGLAYARRRLGQWERAVASLEAAASLAEPGSRSLARVILEYTACLQARPGRWPRVIALIRRFRT